MPDRARDVRAHRSAARASRSRPFGGASAVHRATRATMPGVSCECPVELMARPLSRYTCRSEQLAIRILRRSKVAHPTAMTAHQAPAGQPSAQRRGRPRRAHLAALGDASRPQAVEPAAAGAARRGRARIARPAPHAGAARRRRRGTAQRQRTGAGGLGSACRRRARSSASSAEPACSSAPRTTADRRRTIVRLHEELPRGHRRLGRAGARATARHARAPVVAGARAHFMEGWRILHEEATRTSPVDAEDRSGSVDRAQRARRASTPYDFLFRRLERRFG